MKKQLLSISLGLLFVLSMSAQNNTSVSNSVELKKDNPKKETAISSEMITRELNELTTYLANEIEYTELTRLYNLEGEMVVRIVFDGEIQNLEIINSLNPDLDKLVISKIENYARNWDNKGYENIPLLTFEIPFQFRLKG